ncbi:hypothetical protein ScPMuIL_011777 [Solemya velum]
MSKRNTSGEVNNAFEKGSDLELSHNKLSGDDFVGVCCSGPHQVAEGGKEAEVEVDDQTDLGLEYGVEDTPPPHLCIVFGLQQVLLSISSTISIPLIVSQEICAGDLEVVKSEIMSTFLFMCGVCTILQTTIGVRLPIIQGDATSLYQLSLH